MQSSKEHPGLHKSYSAFSALYVVRSGVSLSYMLIAQAKPRIFQAGRQHTRSALEERGLIRICLLQIFGNLPAVINAFPTLILIDNDRDLHSRADACSNASYDIISPVLALPIENIHKPEYNLH